MAANDFNGDGRSDILFRQNDGAIFNILGLPNGAFTNNGQNSWMMGGQDWAVAGIGDFNGDGRSDILWRNSDGLAFNGLSGANGGQQDNYDNGWLMIDSAWQVAGVGDFNGDGRADILVRAANGTITNYLGQSNGGFKENSANLFTTVNPDWRVAAIGDFNGDGRDDIMWRHANGAIFDFLGSATGGVINNGDNSWVAVDTSWRFVGSGDFDGNGRSDILWRRDDGAMFDFLGTANGGVANNGDHSWTMTPTGQQIASLADFNGDGRDDILWRDGAGTITNWLGTPAGSFSPNPATEVLVDPRWVVQDPALLPYHSGVGFWDY